MELTAEYIQNIVDGRLTLPLACEFDFHMETEKVIKKAKSDKRFIYINKALFVWDLIGYDDGRYVGDEFVGFKLGNEWVLFVENETQSLMIGTDRVDKVIDAYFTDVNTKDNTFTKARMLKTYFHYYPNTKQTEVVRRRRRVISDEEFKKLADMFKTQDFTEFKTADELSKYYDELPDNSPTISVLKIDDTYTFMVKQDQNVGFHFILANKDNLNILEFSYYPRKESPTDPFSFLDVYKQACPEGMPEVMKFLIAHCFRGADSGYTP